ncbi:hypothetical protein D477_007846 [Arthrobacter crystallopoietes BAB-32]|uniref:Uncharacterized protein n=1 Tax=Arthrobacter crystallopoietes BAB-32 TaxID=1246476 RepID=N1V995_9MICC|nr:hypothetical protein [Arthrobacter crystallopoietes]EMY34813.1 hypothetical protein D477_007846 [Arthrobacter crystallopoietes BAB-32]
MSEESAEPDQAQDEQARDEQARDEQAPDQRPDSRQDADAGQPSYPGPEPEAHEELSPDLGEPEVASAEDPAAAPEEFDFPEPGVTPGPAEELDRESPDDRGLTTETSSSE